MSSAAIMDTVLSKIKVVLSEAEEVLTSDATPEQVEEVNRLFGRAMWKQYKQIEQPRSPGNTT